jgi:hypothetical protein
MVNGTSKAVTLQAGGKKAISHFEHFPQEVNMADIMLRPDAKGRIALGKLAKGVSSYRLQQESNGRLVLEPYVEIPERERWLYRNPAALAAVEEGLRDVAAGRTVSLGSFAQYADDDLEQD